jgi:hypothetical protein
MKKSASNKLDQKIQILLIGGENELEKSERLDSFIKNHPNYKTEYINADEVNNFNDFNFLSGEQGLFSAAKIIIIKNVLSQKNIRDGFVDYLEKLDINNFINQELKLIFLESGSIDKRSKLYKILKKNFAVLDFPAAKSGEKKIYIIEYFKNNNLAISGELIRDLVNKFETSNLLKIKNELNKIKLICDYENETEVKKEHLELVTVELNEQIWNLIKLALTNKDESYDLLNKLFAQQIHFSQIIGFISSQLKQVSDYYFFPNKLNSFSKRNAQELANNISKKKLVILTEKLFDLDYALKSSRLDAKLGLTLYLGFF